MEQVTAYNPRLINGLTILAVGYIVARLVRWLVTIVFRRVRFDPLVERTGITDHCEG